MRIALVCIREHQGESEGPEEKASHYTVRPDTLGSTLACLRDVVIYSALCQIHSSCGVFLAHSTRVTCCLFLALSIHINVS
jgi:hypothetical protein